MAATAPTGLGIALLESQVGPSHSAVAPVTQSSSSSKDDVLRSNHSMAGPSDVIHEAAKHSESMSGTLSHATAPTIAGTNANDPRHSISRVSSSQRTDANIPGRFVRSDTLLSFGRSQTRSAAELQALMGNSNSRLKAGATVHVSSINRNTQGSGDTEAVALALEQAKRRSRVEVDIVLESDTFVQGGFMKGHVKVRVCKRSRKEDPVCLADPKVRVVGFEGIPGEGTRHTFYQCASPLSSITDSVDRLFDTSVDDDGFARAMEGVHTLPFAMRLPTDSRFGAAKGVLNLHSGAIVQYIAMVSMKIKDTNTGKRSIAHFFRNCEVWPRLNASILLSPAPRPLQATTSKSLAMLSSDRKVKLTAQLHRLNWIAGQRCYVSVAVANDTKKTVKSFTLTLIRSTTMFKPTPELDAGCARSADPDACQTSTIHKVVSETSLEIAESGAKGRASAKGWWTGVGPGKELSFSHYILIPPDALSVTRSRLLEVEYTIRITLSAGSLTPDVHVTLPIRVINFLSIDPIPSDPTHSLLAEPVHPLKRRRSIDGELDPPSGVPLSQDEISAGRQAAAGAYTAHSLDIPQRLGRSTHGERPRDSSLHVTNPDQVPLSIPASESSDSDASAYSSDASYQSSVEHLPSSADAPIPRGLGNLDLEDPDSDEEVEFVVGSARLDEPEDPTIAGPEYGTSRAIVPRPAGPRSGSRCDRDRGRTRDVRPIQRRNTINVGPLPRREYQKVRDETERRARTSFVEGVNERLLVVSPRRGSRRRGRHPAVSAHGSDGGTSDVDATPRLMQDLADVPRVPIRPLRPSRKPARRTPAPNANGVFPTGSSNGAMDIMSTAESVSAQPSVIPQASTWRSRALPRPPVNFSAVTADTGSVTTTAPTTHAVEPGIYEGVPGHDRYPTEQLERCQIVNPTTAGGHSMSTASRNGHSLYPSDMQYVAGIGEGRDRLRGRTPRVHTLAGGTSRSESSSSTSTSTSSSGYDSGHTSETSLTSMHSSESGRPTAGMGQAGASDSAVQVRITELEDRVKCARSVASAFA